MLESTPPLRIAVLGVGKIGSAFAFQLARAGGHDVTVIARQGSLRLAQLERDKAIVDVMGERAAVRVADELDESVAYDLLIVTLLAYQAEHLLPSLRRSVAGCVQFMCNTFDPDRLQSAVGIERCGFGLPFIQSTLDTEGRLDAKIGATGQKTIMDQDRWVTLFNSAGLPSKLEHRMPLWLRCHAPLCVAFESVCVAGERRGGGASWAEVLKLSQGVRSCYDLIEFLGYEIYPSTKQRIATNPAWVFGSVLWIMSRITSFRKLLSTGKVEAAELVKVMVLAAPAGLHREVVSKIEAMTP